MREWVKSESLRKHMLCVGGGNAGLRAKFGEDEEMWELPDYSTILIMKISNVDAAAKPGIRLRAFWNYSGLSFHKRL